MVYSQTKINLEIASWPLKKGSPLDRKPLKQYDRHIKHVDPVLTLQLLSL